jgi:hypothetical protein
VVAAIKEGSVQWIPHADTGGGSSGEHHVLLKVSSTLKGKSAAAEIPVTLDYGVTPTTRTASGLKPTTLPGAKEPLMIVDVGGGFGVVLADSLRENIWLLRLDKDARYHVTDPEDLQPLALKGYLACYLAQDPETAVRAQVQRQPEIATRATRYLAHLEIQRIRREPDAAVRAERLLPYVMAGYPWAVRHEAGKALADCGASAGPYLMGAYQLRPNEPLPEDIIELWGKIRYVGAVDVLIGILDDGDRFWGAQELKTGWWNEHPESPLTRTRREQYGMAYKAVAALEAIGSSRARDAIEKTRRRWAAIEPEEHWQIVEVCDRALATLNRSAK